MQEARDFEAESGILHDAVAGLDDAGLRRATQFKGYTIEDVLVHLHFWNGLADLALDAPDRFEAEAAGMKAILLDGGFRPCEDARVPERGRALVGAWIARARDMARRWAGVDPARRLPWIGPSMSARTAMSARHMETWAHGFEVHDCLGLEREEADRIRNVVVLGVNTFAWSHRVHGLDVPAAMPELRLTAPSGAAWTWGDAAAGRISGPAADFAAVVTQARAFADTALEAEGDAARTWMAHAQCFAGAPVMPPEPGTRRRAGAGAT